MSVDMSKGYVTVGSSLPNVYHVFVPSGTPGAESRCVGKVFDGRPVGCDVTGAAANGKNKFFHDIHSAARWVANQAV